MSQIKVTVFRRVDPSVIFDGEVPNMPGTDKPFVKCTAFEDGQEFIVENGRKPDGFCEWAWYDIKKDISILQFGGNFWKNWMKPGEMLTCCTDGVRPVSFKLERLED
ncbi:MAG: TIGR04076 family protein [Candidatus Bathyarchaeota archaeon]|nr:TIGR04076 family protein [Candidatus Bathyarchaeota archaeon]